MLDIKTLLNNEKQIGKNPYSAIDKSVFEEIDSALDKAKDLSKYQEEALSLLERDNQKDSSSIVLSYILGYIKLKERPHEIPVRLNNLAMDLYNYRNSEAADYVAKKILESTESAKAILVEAYLAKDKGDDESMWALYEKYTKSTNDDVDIILEVAEHYWSTGDNKKAEGYLRRDLMRLKSKGDMQKTEDAMRRLLKHGTNEIEYYISYADSIKSDNKELALELLKSILQYLIKKNENTSDDNPVYKSNLLSTIIDVSKEILELDSENKEARIAANDAIISQFGKETRFADVIAAHDIISSENPLKEINDFILEIAYTEKRFVQSIKNPDKIGLIVDTKSPKVKVKFSSTETVEMKMSDLIKEYTPLSNKNIKAIRKGVPRNKIREKIFGEGGIDWLIKTLLYSSPNKEATLKDMKSEVVPYILSDAEWDNMSKSIKEALKTNPYIKINIDGNNEKYRLVNYETTQEEKQKALFETVAPFYKKAEIFLSSLMRKDLNRDDDLFLDMATYFNDTLNKNSSPNHEKVSSKILLEIASEKKLLLDKGESSWSFMDLTSEEKRSAFASIDNHTIRKKLIDKIAKEDKANAFGVLESLFPLYISSYIPSKMKALDKDAYYQFIQKTISSYGGNPAAFVFFATENRPSDEELKKANVDSTLLIKNEIKALYSLSSSTLTQELRKYQKELRDTLLDKGELFTFLENASEEDIEEVKSQILSGEAFEFKTKSKVKEILKERFPNINLVVNSLSNNKDKSPAASASLFASSSAYRKKEAEFDHIQNVEIPQILIDINKAAELGDLRENSEFKTAKEKKSELEAKVKQIKKELSTVKIVKSEDVKGDKIEFGNKAKLYDNKNQREIEYTFMGIWESDPANNIIDISAPIGLMLKGKRVGDNVKFTLNTVDFDLTVLSIEKYNFD